MLKQILPVLLNENIKNEVKKEKDNLKGESNRTKQTKK